MISTVLSLFAFMKAMVSIQPLRNARTTSGRFCDQLVAREEHVGDEILDERRRRR